MGASYRNTICREAAAVLRDEVRANGPDAAIDAACGLMDAVCQMLTDQLGYEAAAESVYRWADHIVAEHARLIGAAE